MWAVCTSFSPIPFRIWLDPVGLCVCVCMLHMHIEKHLSEING